MLVGLIPSATMGQHPFPDPPPHSTSGPPPPPTPTRSPFSPPALSHNGPLDGGEGGHVGGDVRRQTLAEEVAPHTERDQVGRQRGGARDGEAQSQAPYLVQAGMGVNSGI